MLTIEETPVRLLINGPRNQLSALAEHFRYHPNNYRRATSYSVFKTSGGKAGWDGYHYPFFVRGGAAEMLRGRKDELLAVCKEKEFGVDTSKFLDSPFHDITIDDVPPDAVVSEHELDDKQREAIALWLKHGMGIAHFAVNAGKTLTFAGAAACIKRKYKNARFLYYTPSERLVKQTFGVMLEALPGWNVTQFGGGKKDDSGKDMVVCTQAMLARHFDTLVANGWFRTFHAILIDESHHAQSATAEAVIRSCVAFFRLAASDTMKESDPEKHSKIVGLCGPVRCTVTSGELIEAGRSATPHIYLVDVRSWKGKFDDLEHTPELSSAAWTLIDGQWIKATYRGPVYVRDRNGKIETKSQTIAEDGMFKRVRVPVTEDGVHLLRLENGDEIKADASCTLLDRRYDKAIIRFKERNELIKQWVKYYAIDNKWPTLVVATRSTHVMILDTLLREVAGDNVRSLTGEDTGRQKDRVLLDWFRSTPGAVLISSIVKEGISINEIQAGVIADPIADWEVAKQLIGRFIRKKEHNHAYITWFVDRQHARYLKNAKVLFDKLAKLDGYVFYHPVQGPDTIPQAEVHHGSSTRL